MTPGRPALAVVAGAVAAAALAGCTPGPKAVDEAALNAAIDQRLGGVGTCVVLFEQAGGGEVYRYGTYDLCRRALPDCAGGAAVSTRDRALSLRTAPPQGFSLEQRGPVSVASRSLSCSSVADGSRSVGWTFGAVYGGPHDLVYAASLEGPTAPPGRELDLRLKRAFADAGLWSRAG